MSYQKILSSIVIPLDIIRPIIFGIEEALKWRACECQVFVVSDEYRVLRVKSRLDVDEYGELMYDDILELHVDACGHGNKLWRLFAVVIWKFKNTVDGIQRHLNEYSSMISYVDIHSDEREEEYEYEDYEMMLWELDLLEFEDLMCKLISY